MGLAIDVVLNGFLIEREHGQIRIEQFFNQKLEELLSDTPLINTGLSSEHHSQRLLEVLIWLGDHTMCIIENCLPPDLEHQVHASATHA